MNLLGRVRRWFWSHSLRVDADERAARQRIARDHDDLRRYMRAMRSGERDPSSVRRRSSFGSWRARWMSDADLRQRPAPERRVAVSFGAPAVPHYPKTKWIIGPNGPRLMPDVEEP